MSAMRRAICFVRDYASRHAHPVNAVLHIVGVPMVALSLYFAFSRAIYVAAFLFILGYVLQFLGHRVQGNEAGEVTLIRRVFASLAHGSR